MLQVRRWALSGELESCEERAVVLAPHRTTELGGTALAVDSRHVLEAELRVDGGTRARASLWAEPLKYLTVADPGLTCESSGEGKLRLTCRAPAKGVWVESEPTVTWSDNGFDLFPGQPTRFTRLKRVGFTSISRESLARAVSLRSAVG